MYIVFEYLTYLTLVALFGLVLFAVAAGLLLSRKGATMAASLARRTATRVSRFANNHGSTLITPTLQRLHQRHQITSRAAQRP